MAIASHFWGQQYRNMSKNEESQNELRLAEQQVAVALDIIHNCISSPSFTELKPCPTAHPLLPAVFFSFRS
jgi:hypothetical protein